MELAQAGRHDDNLTLLREALTRYPKELEVVICAAEAEVAEAPERAGDLARQAVRLAPDDPVILTRATSVLFYVGPLQEARNLFIRATRLADEEFVLAEHLVYLGGQIAFAAGDRVKARELFQLAFESDPAMAGYGFALAGLLEDQGERQRALEVTEEALSHRPDDSQLTELRSFLRVALYGLDALPPRATIRVDGQG